MLATILSVALSANGFTVPTQTNPDAKEKEQQTAFQAARMGDVKALSEYLERQQSADIRTARGDTLLILSVYHGHVEASKLLLTKTKIDVNAVNNMGFTALAGAAFKGNLALTKLLLEHRAKIDAANEMGQTPLMFAAMMNRDTIVKELLTAGANHTLKTTEGDTAASLARKQGHETLAKFLEAYRR